MKRDYTFGRDIRKLPIVCQDRGSYWHYDKERDIYYRVYQGGSYSLIMGQYLPDPAEIEAVRPDRKPTAATYLLWQHRNSIK